MMSKFYCEFSHHFRSHPLHPFRRIRFWNSKIYFLVFFFMVVFLIGAVAAQTESVNPTFRGSQGQGGFNGNPGGGFQGDNSYTFSNPQFASPGFFGGGLGRYDRIDPALEQKLCREKNKSNVLVKFEVN